MGRGSYIPSKSEGDDHSIAVDYFTFSSSIAEYLRAASLVISHAGSGSIFETLQLRKPLIVVVNEDLMDNHQSELAEELTDRKHLYYAHPQTLCRIIADMEVESLIPYHPDTMAMTWKLLKQLRAPYTITASTSLHRILPPRLLNLHNATRLFSNGPPLPPSGEPPLIQLPQNPPSPSPSSLNQAELAKFAIISGTWWDLEGPFKPLHAMNPTRLAFIRSTLCGHFRRDPLSARPFEGLRFIDVGCGGGILSEPLARMGAIVTGVDAVEKNIKIARLHADLDPVTSKIEYQCTTAEKLVEEQKSFDAVFALEVIEHVENPADFCKSLSALTVTSGATVISTINRSMRAYATAIIAAEYLLHWLPKGTHQWSNFLTPEELVLILECASISVQEMAGFAYNPLMGRWSISDDVSVNFIAYGTKTKTGNLEI